MLKSRRGKAQALKANLYKALFGLLTFPPRSKAGGSKLCMMALSSPTVPAD
jgi:hypothetical protein